MKLHQIKKLKETSDIEVANALLTSGWALIDIYQSRAGGAVFILGIGQV